MSDNNTSTTPQAGLQSKPDPRQPTSKPWEGSENVWVKDIFKIKRRKGFRPRFMDKDNIQRRLDEGWMFASSKDYGMDAIKRTDGTIDTKIKRNGMFLMEIPESLAKQRDKFIEDKTKSQSVDARKQAKDAAKKISRQLGEDVDLH